jgi:hypothetical protein
MKQVRGSTCRAPGAAGRRGNAGTSRLQGRRCTCGWEDRLESRHSMPGAEFLLRSSCVDQRSRGSKSTVGTGAESPMSAQDPAGSPSSGLLMTQPWCGPTPQTDDSPSSGLRRTRSAESTIPIDQPHIWDRSTSNSQPGEDGSKPCSISHRAATRLRSDHQARITSRSTSAP